MSSQTIPRSPAFPPVLTSDKLREIARRDVCSERAAAMVAMARSGGQSAEQDRCVGERDEALQRDLWPVYGIGQGMIGVAHVCRAQPAWDPELWRELSQWRTDRARVCGVDREQSGEQTLLQTTTHAVVHRRGARVVAAPSADVERRSGRHLQALVSGPRHQGRGDPDDGVTPRTSLLSLRRAPPSAFCETSSSAQ